MSFFNPDFSADLQKRQVKFVIQNCYNYQYYGSGKGVTSANYIPYNLIFTDDFVFGENISVLGENALKMTYNSFDIGSFNGYIAKCNATKDYTGFHGKIDVNYPRIKEIRLNSSDIGAGQGVQFNTKLYDLSASLQLRWGLGNSHIFVIKKELINVIQQSLSEVFPSLKINIGEMPPQ
jgi:hypothetical protein